MKKAFAIIAFILLLGCTYFAADRVLSIKTEDAIGTMEKYQALPKDTVDVLMVGSSHVGMNVDNSIIWDKYGIASYNLWGGMQPLWNSYYYVKEGLKHQQPKVVVVEVFLAGTDADYSSKDVAIKNVHALPFGLDKIQAALASYPTWQEAAEAVWGLPYYHNRYGELTVDDLKPDLYTKDLGVSHINLTMDRTTQVNMLDYSAITGEENLSKKNEDYLRKIIDLCKSMKVELLFLISPYEANETEAMRLNRLTSIANENGVPVLNYLKCWQDTGLDPSVDFYDVGHLRTTGIAKLSASVGAYLKENYDLPDRREDEKHIWNTGESAGSTADTEATAAYVMETQFVGDGVARMIDTGVKLYDNRYGSWTLLTRLDMTTVGDDGVYLSCFSEDMDKGLYGMLIRKTRDNTLSLILGENFDMMLPSYDGRIATLGIVKNSETYTVYWNGEVVVNNRSLPCEAYSGNLLVGCQEQTANGAKMRFSQTRVMNLEVYQGVLPGDEILAWDPPTLPDMPLPLGQSVEKAETVYTLPEQFIGGDERFAAYVDTGVKLYEDAGTRFTLLAELLPQQVEGDGVYLADFAEEDGHYRGLLVRQVNDDQLNIVYGNNNGIGVPLTLGEPVRLAVMKDGAVYTVYVNGQKVLDQVQSAADAYAGTLLVGAEFTDQGRVFRKSKTRVNSLEVLAGCLTEEEILAWPYTAAPEPKVIERVATSANYKMEDAFLGNGRDRYLDTGVMLFDTDKDWTLDTELTMQQGANRGVYLSCFAEQPDIGYRGFMIRQDTEDTVTVYVGGLLSWRYDLPAGRSRMHVVVVKQGNDYTIAMNGEVQATLTSACAPYDGTLLVGCQADADGNIFRCGSAAVDALTVQDGAIPADEAAERSVLVETNSRF